MKSFVILCIVAFPILRTSNAQDCRFIGDIARHCTYNWTRYDNPDFIYNPNLPKSLERAIYLNNLIVPVIESGCSLHTELFACAAFFPNCVTGLAPCQSLCNIVLTDCSVEFQQDLIATYVVLQNENILDCEKYQSEDSNDTCISPPPRTEVVSPTGLVPSPSPSPNSSPSSSHSNKTNNNTANTTGCPPTHLNYFTDGSKRFSLGWIATWSLLTFLSTLLTLFTFLLKPSRFQYPWRPIVYLAVCFNVHSIGYMLGLVLGRKIVTCPGNEYMTSSVSWGWVHVPCILVFSVLYYTMMAAFLWWLVLTLAWFLATAFKWSNEAVGSLAPFFHIVSWVLPLLMLICMIAARIISADELTGMCFIVRDETTASFYALLVGVILPLLVFLLIGIIFLTFGLISVCRIHAFLRVRGQEKESIVLEKLIIRVGIFVSIYVFPAAVLIGCYFYELDKRPKWNTRHEIDSGKCGDGDCLHANPTVIIVRVFVFLLIGVLTGVWIWSKKTLDSWKDAFNKVQTCCVPKYDLPQPTSSPPKYNESMDAGTSMNVLKY